jgi:hypothetical protein
MTTRKYRGALAVRSRPKAATTPAATALLTGSRAGEWTNESQVVEHDLRGLELLLKHYRIEQPDPAVRFMCLALALARDHVPYFQEAGAKRGTKPDRKRLFRLILDVAIERAKGGASERAALERLCESDDFWRGNDPDHLARALRAARKRDEALVSLAQQVVAEFGRRFSGPQLVRQLNEVRKSF